MAKPAFRIHNGEVVVPTDQERISDALAEVKASLKDVKDPAVWGDYPDGDGWRPGDEGDEDEPGKRTGLFLNLERLTRSNSTWQMAWAIEIAFALGRTAEGAKLSPAELERLGKRTLAQIRAQKSADKRQQKKAGWFADVERFVREEREQFPRATIESLSLTAWERLGSPKTPKPATIYDAIRKRIAGEARHQPSAPRRRPMTHAADEGRQRSNLEALEPGASFLGY